MPEDTVFDSTNRGTLRPNKDALQTSGTIFKPMKLPYQGQEITLLEYVSPNDLITLFSIYYTSEFIQQIVKRTNQYLRKPKDDLRPYVQVNYQYLICSTKIYLYFVIRIYITLYIENEISNYQKTLDNSLIYLIQEYISRNRFQELYIRIRFYRPEVKAVYRKAYTPLSLLSYLYSLIYAQVDLLSRHIQEVNLRVQKPRRDLVVDKIIV